MQIETVHALLFAPYPELIEIAERAAADYPQVHMDTFVGTFEYAVRYATAHRTDDFDVLIARGGTASLLREKLDIPVVDIDISTGDVLRSVKMAELCSTHFAFVAYPAMTRVCRTLCEILKYADLPVEDTPCDLDTEAVVGRLAAQGVDLIIGDVHSTLCAERMGLKSILVTSTADSVRHAFEEALRMFQGIRRRQDQEKMYRLALDRMQESVLIYNDGGELVYANGASVRRLPARLREHLTELLPELRQKQKLHVLRQDEGGVFDVVGECVRQESAPFCMYHVSSCSAATPESDGIRIENSEDSRRREDFLLPDSAYIRPMREELDKICRSDAPVCIRGRQGSERSSVARYIHWNGPTSSGPFIFIHCHRLNEAHWRRFSETCGALINTRGCTVFLEDVDQLSPPLQMDIDRYIMETGMDTRHRLISSCVSDLGELTGQGRFNQSLYMRLCPLIIRVPSLNARAADIPALAGLYINRFNQLLGREVVGLDEDALQLLLDFDWTMDMAQFQLVIRRLVEACASSYVTGREMRETLSMFGTQPEPEGDGGLDLNRSLDAIETDIIRRVLKEEGMNQSLAARRLGVSRTTIWRKMNESLQV